VPALILPDRSLIRVEGADAQHFLQNLITTNIDAIAPGEAWPAALLTPQGKILFDFLISKSGETGYDCDIRTDQAADFIRRLTLYKLRASVQFNRLEDQPVIAGWDEDAPRGALRDRRFPEEAHVWRLYGSGAVSLISSRRTGTRSGSPTEWLNRARISHSRMCFPMTC
jgi:folate-binding Fe-S cluster repair protein YgfZ